MAKKIFKKMFFSQVINFVFKLFSIINFKAPTDENLNLAKEGTYLNVKDFKMSRKNVIFIIKS